MAFLGPSLRRTRVSERPAARIGAAVVVSLVVNAVLLLAAQRMGAFQLARPGAEQRVVLAPLTADQWNRNKAITGQAQPAPRAAVPPPPVAPTPPPPPPEAKPKGQVVDVAPSPNSTPPKDSRFLAEHDSSVEKETRSRDQGTRVYPNRAPRPVEGGPQRNRPAGEGGEAKESREAKRGTNAPRGTGAERAPAQPPPAKQPAAQEPPDQLALLERKREEGLTESKLRRPPGANARPEERQGVPGLPGAPSEPQKKLGDARLLPSAASMAKVMAGPSNDDLRGLEEGDATSLNTRAFKYAGFWNRFKQDVAAQWRPGIAYDARDPQHTTYPIRDRETAILVVLDANGALKYPVKILQSSGLDFLDNEAVRAVTAAAPFSNPPAGVVDEAGEIKIPFRLALIFDHMPAMRPIYPRGAGPEQ